MEQVSAVIFYTIEKAIKSYRRLAQRQFKSRGLAVTVDQWLTLSALQDNPRISQKELGEIIFKDNASVTRIIGLLIKKGHLQREDHSTDKRRSRLTITAKGKRLLNSARAVVKEYRSRALKNISPADLSKAREVMNNIIKNSVT
jgi:MarR family transcriptional regulator, transcriptional regulator for hemolysin